MKVKDFLAVIEPSDRVLIVNGEEEIYRGYAGLMRYHKFELDKYLDIDVLRIREKTEIWHKYWKERGLTAPLSPKETPDYLFKDMRIKGYYEIYIGEDK